MIPETLREFIDEDGDRIRLRARDETSQPIGMLIIPDGKFKVTHAFLPTELSKIDPQGRNRQTVRMFFIVPDLPANITTMQSEELMAFFTGYRMSFPAGEWIDNPPMELPTVAYADITRLLGMQAPVSISTPAPSSETTPEGFRIPQEMKNANQWLIWKYGERDGKKTKIPLNPKTLTNTSAPEATWSTKNVKPPQGKG